ncbi:uncharacterized protein DFL_008086 [Arthrobotrys flagrans]|uniref:Arsenite methyltransferase n=1 Tax=Arthrobotrys flagrans TaxID=97331 RepID=A0A436ZMR6_ARTFL|nr:hypothetical protein DFL_008086 [Arthrobotrys flagrans]
MDPNTIYHHVQSRYGSIARAENPQYSSTVAKAFGYSQEDLNSIPKDANLGLSCGNPLAIASLRPGETVVDLGCGGGFDVFLAAKQVGQHGRVIGIDMNKDMLSRARKNLTESTDINNAIFKEGIITSIPLEDATADCIISNCVVNLVPAAEKALVFVEIARILKPGGRVAISDILAKKELPASIKEDVAMYTGCIAGAATIGEYEKYLEDTGFSEILIVDTKSDLNVYINSTDLSNDGDTSAGCCMKPIEAMNEGDVASCCVSSPKAERVVCDGTAVEVANSGSGRRCINLNDWVGEYKLFI